MPTFCRAIRQVFARSFPSRPSYGNLPDSLEVAQTPMMNPVCPLFCGLAAGRDDPLEVLCIVPANWYYFGYTAAELKEEPMIDATIIPASEWGGFRQVMFSSDQVRRTIRRYFPRSYEDLTWAIPATDMVCFISASKGMNPPNVPPPS